MFDVVAGSGGFKKFSFKSRFAASFAG